MLLCICRESRTSLYIAGTLGPCFPLLMGRSRNSECGCIPVRAPGAARDVGGATARPRRPISHDSAFYWNRAKVQCPSSKKIFDAPVCPLATALVVSSSRIDRQPLSSSLASGAQVNLTPAEARQSEISPPARQSCMCGTPCDSGLSSRIIPAKAGCRTGSL